jgi:hypothetical protein
MPYIGEIASGKMIGLSSGRYIWTRCPDCSKERWTPYKPHDSASIRRCQPCHRSYTKQKFKLKEEH